MDEDKLDNLGWWLTSEAAEAVAWRTHAPTAELAKCLVMFKQQQAEELLRDTYQAQTELLRARQRRRRGGHE
jgi:hypothetical protein